MFEILLAFVGGLALGYSGRMFQDATEKRAAMLEKEEKAIARQARSLKAAETRRAKALKEHPYPSAGESIAKANGAVTHQ